MTVFVDYIEPLQRFTQRKLECLDVCYFSSTHTHTYTRATYAILPHYFLLLRSVFMRFLHFEWLTRDICLL